MVIPVTDPDDLEGVSKALALGVSSYLVQSKHGVGDVANKIKSLAVPSM